MNKKQKDEKMFGTNNEGWYVFWSGVGLLIMAIGAGWLISLFV